MKLRRRRKCRHCGQLYRPDQRNVRRQKYCSQAACRQASKAVSQRRWLRSPKGRDYFTGSTNVLRVQLWRKAHQGYWRRRCQKSAALQDVLFTQVSVPLRDKPCLNEREGAISKSQPEALPSEQLVLDPRNPIALQDVLSTHLALQLGLIEQLSGALQDDIAPLIQRLILRGRQLKGRWTLDWNSHGGGQTSFVPRTLAPDAGTVQLDRPAPGAG